MLHPIVCQNERLRHYLQNFRGLFSRPQYGHFETVLFGLLMSKEGHTMSHLHRAIAGIKSVSSVSRFLGPAAKKTWTIQGTLRNRVSDRRRLDPVQTQRQEDGRFGEASLNDV